MLAVIAIVLLADLSRTGISRVPSRGLTAEIWCQIYSQAAVFFHRETGLIPTLALLVDPPLGRWSQYLVAPGRSDPWGQAYRLSAAGTPLTFTVTSAGPDTELGTADDISASTSSSR